MIFIPKKSKYKKQFKGKLPKQLYKKLSLTTLILGRVGLKALEGGILPSKIFNTIKNAIKKIIKKFGRVFFFAFPQIAKSKKPIEVRMGKGKGAIALWVSKIRMGATICEISTPNVVLGIKALEAVRFRLPIKTKVIFERKY